MQTQLNLLDPLSSLQTGRDGQSHISAKKRNFAKGAVQNQSISENRLIKQNGTQNQNFQSLINYYANEGINNGQPSAQSLNTNADIKEDDAYSFWDVIDVINPLHHIPVVGHLYRSFTGDELKSMSSIIGSTLYGGPVGAVASTINAVIEHQTGSDVANTALAYVGLEQQNRNPKIEYGAPKTAQDFDPGTRTALFDRSSYSPEQTTHQIASRHYTATSHYNS